ncbi:hypothetical protein NUU61_008507 [Penicillium alfredii]|uniref:Uncharacterized protein n=1 Tax=Penicillium alfredii TaxID=1506179 RepID=A0A9W9ELA2_9EURO|nr:uncharacterized protein NUU61_008507 [Penicillium alfredii]KAJ5083928.1 hypothetical protein NUU61_008507 [Penicillium alfredii]
MAPINTRQYHSLGPSIPHPPKGPPATPVPVTKSISSKVFTELFAGTLGIFVLAVLFWKTGKFIRSFNKNKVLREGKAPTARYARTWYGWVSLETHQRNKRVFGDLFAWVRRWTAWKSTRTDYRWVWWDPGQKEMEKRRRQQRPLRWLPELLQSYEFLTADEIWNPTAVPECHGGLVEHSRVYHPVQVNGCSQSLPPTDIDSVPQRQIASTMETDETDEIGQETWKRPRGTRGCLSDDPVKEGLQHGTRVLSRFPPKLSTKTQSLPCLHLPRRSRLHSSWQQPGKLQVMAHPKCSLGQYANPQPEWRVAQEQVVEVRPHQPHTDRYRAWSARMQIEANRRMRRGLVDSSGPLGTPIAELLSSCASGQSVAFGLVPQRRRDNNSDPMRNLAHRGSFPFILAIERPSRLPSKDRTDFARTAWYSAPVRWRLSEVNTASRVTGVKAQRNLRNIFPTSMDHDDFVSLGAPNTQSNALSCTAERPPLHTNPFEELSDWEVRLIDRLDRKLVWLFNEFTPGQKPYHFAMLANHWLNRKTWIVIDPVSRVSTDARREWGDSRFNVPYRKPEFGPKPKYPNHLRKRAHTPRIDSWRAAVNQQRKVSGVREMIRTVELYENSVEEPPDGKIDPSCWILPKPPQGFEMSTKQKNAWYEGGCGWQEKLEDWQHVCRGYRVRKAIHEGRVNRTRVKELATQAGNYCRTAWLKVIPDMAIEQVPSPIYPVP